MQSLRGVLVIEDLDLDIFDGKIGLAVMKVICSTIQRSTGRFMWKSFIKSEKKQPHMAIQTEIWTAGKGVYVCVCLSLSSLKSCISSLGRRKRVCVTWYPRKTAEPSYSLTNCTDSSKGTNLETEQQVSGIIFSVLLFSHWDLRSGKSCIISELQPMWCDSEYTGFGIRSPSFKSWPHHLLPGVSLDESVNLWVIWKVQIVTITCSSQDHLIHLNFLPSTCKHDHFMIH